MANQEQSIISNKLTKCEEICTKPEISKLSIEGQICGNASRKKVGLKFSKRLVFSPNLYFSNEQ